VTYAVVTPVRDEAAALTGLAASLAAQTVRPQEWVIVENGSADGTLAVARRLAREHDWIRVVLRPAGPPQVRGGNVVRALHDGFAALSAEWELVAKVDADVTLGHDYFERLLAAFAADPRLGLASGGCWELEGGAWRERGVTGSHVWGAARAYRRACLADLLPLDERMGWDGIDQIRAETRGWKVERVAGLRFRHHRREGERDGSRLRVWAVQGSAAHYMGYRFSYLLARTLYRAWREPAAIALLGGYAAAAVRRSPRCPDRAVRQLLRRRQRARRLLRCAREAAPR
jgi:biofilm PGA synthesis N-glycosyltransferase PgaC